MISCACIVVFFSYCTAQESLQEPIIIQPVRKIMEIGIC